MTKQEALELLVQYAEAFVRITERDIDYRNYGLKEITQAKEILSNKS